jgi:3-oxoadipate enol-lactonase
VSEQSPPDSPSSSSTDADFVLVRSFDGSEIAIRSSGQGTGAFLFCNAVGATLAPWRQVLASLGRTRRWVTWDHRGLLASPPPVLERPDPAVHAADAIAAMDHLGIEAFPVVAWSNGTRVALELAARHSRRVTALVLVNPTYGRSFSPSLQELDPAAALPWLAGVARRFPAAAGMALRQLAGRRELPGLIRQSGLLGPAIDPEPLIETLQAMASSDPQRLLATFEAVAGSSVEEVLPSIAVSTLVVMGARDRLTPRGADELFEELLPNVRVLSYEGGTHYLSMDFPERLVTDIDSFLGSLT